MQQGIHKLLEKTYFLRSSDTLVTLTPSYPLVTFHLKPKLPCILLERGLRVSLLGGNMKKIGLLVLLIAVAAGAQSAAEPTSADSNVPQGTIATSANFPVQRVEMPTYADIYCAGFINRQTLPDANFVAGGLQTPSTTKFVRGDIVYLKGSGYSAGAEYEIVRALRDINEYEMFPGQAKLLKATGQPYEEVGRVRVIDTRSRAAVAQIEYSCTPINPGDTLIPSAKKQTAQCPPPLRFDRF